MNLLSLAEDRDLDVTAVKAGLLQCSPVYRKLVRQEPDESANDFTNEDLRAVNEVIKSIALGSEDDNLRLKAAMYIRDDKKGRKEVAKLAQSNTFNILSFNQEMSKIRGQADKIKQLVNV